VSAWLYIEDVDEKYAPAEKPLLRLSVVENGLAVGIVQIPSGKGMEYEEVAQVLVPFNTVTRALTSLAYDQHERDEWKRSMGEAA
jgi:hypothetical protein